MCKPGSSGDITNYNSFFYLFRENKTHTQRKMRVSIKHSSGLRYGLVHILEIFPYGKSLEVKGVEILPTHWYPL